jgi:hypothetical protein
MAREKVKVNVKVVVNEYDKFTFTETLAKFERVSENPTVVVPYAFPTSTSPNCRVP